MEKINEKHENQVIEKVSEVDTLAIHQSENASEKSGLVSVVYHASWNETDKKTFDEKGFEEDEHEWYETDSELPARIEYLRENADGCGYSLSDCRISLIAFFAP